MNDRGRRKTSVTGILCEGVTDPQGSPHRRCIPFGPRRPDCDPRCEGYQQPTGYVAAAEWAEYMLQTHDQCQCPGCGLWTIWVPKASEEDLRKGPVVTNAQAHIADTLDRAQHCWDQTLNPHAAPEVQRESIAYLFYHVTTAVLLENIRRLDPDLADRLIAWLCDPPHGDDTIFADGLAGELLYEWRQQLAAGQPMHPIGPDTPPPTDRMRIGNPLDLGSLRPKDRP